MRQKVIKFCFMLPLLFLSFAFYSPCSAQNSENLTSYVKIPTQQWEVLVNNTNLLEAKLDLLQNRLATLEKPSQEAMTLLTELKLSLKQTQEKLRTAELSLENVKLSLGRTKALYEKLEIQVEAERKEASKQIKEAYWNGFKSGFLVGLGTGVLIIAK